MLYLYCLICTYQYKDLPKVCDYIYPCDMDTGDILCVSYDNVAGKFVKTCTDSAWVHTGMVWVDPESNVRYVLEGANYRQVCYKNFYKIPVSNWLYINKVSVIGYKKYVGPKLDQNKMIETFKPFMENSKLEGLNHTWIRFLQNDKYKEVTDHKKKFTCFESTIVLGQECGNYKKDKLYSSFFPSCVVNDKIEFCEGVYYEPLKQVLLNPQDAKMLYEDKKKYKNFWNNTAIF